VAVAAIREQSMFAVPMAPQIFSSFPTWALSTLGSAISETYGDKFLTAEYTYRIGVIWYLLKYILVLKESKYGGPNSVLS